MILSHRQMEEIASAAVKDFHEFFFGFFRGCSIQATPID